MKVPKNSTNNAIPAYI